MLRLRTETLYELTADQLTQVVGAAQYESCMTVSCYTEDVTRLVKVQLGSTAGC